MGRKKIYQTDEERKAAQKEAYKRWYEKHKEEEAARMKQYYLTTFGRAVNLASTYRQYDTKYNRGQCTIDAQWIVENVFSGQCCHYCGESDWRVLGVDRKDSSLPHTPENCVPCCDACNKKKHTTPYEEFLKKVS